METMVTGISEWHKQSGLAVWGGIRNRVDHDWCAGYGFWDEPGIQKNSLSKRELGDSGTKEHHAQALGCVGAVSPGGTYEHNSEVQSQAGCCGTSLECIICRDRRFGSRGLTPDGLAPTSWCAKAGQECARFKSVLCPNSRCSHGHASSEDV